MFSDPLIVTIDGQSRSLARKSVGPSSSMYGTSDGEFKIYIKNSFSIDGLERFEILFEHTTPDPTPANVFDNYLELPNRVGLVFEVNPRKGFTSTDIPMLQTALQTFVDATFRGRLLGGEK